MSNAEVSHPAAGTRQPASWCMFRRFKNKELSEDKERYGGGRSLYKAIWTSEDGSKKEVAVKKLDTALSEAEVEILSSLSAKNVCRYYGAVFGPHDFSLVMEWYHGEILFDYIHNRERAQPLKRSEAQELALAIADGMNYLHNQAPCAPVQHNNLSSGKIFLHNKNGTRIPKICGFGNSQFHSATQYTKSQGRMSVYGWISPEAIKNEGVSVKSDVYSYGIILWELLTGKIPYSGEVLQDTISFIENGKHPPIPSDCPDNWRVILKRCWALDKMKRPGFRAILGCLNGLNFPITETGEFSDSHNPPVDALSFSQPYHWRLPKEKYTQLEIGDTAYKGRLSYISKSKYEGGVVAARVIVDSEVSMSSFVCYMNSISQIGDTENIVKLIGGFTEPKRIALFEWMPIVLQNVCPIIDQEKFVKIASGVAKALDTLHSLVPNHIIHGSLSSRTVLLNDKGEAKVTDFNYYTLDSSSFVNRYPDYYDPYAKRYNFRLDIKSDVYSFGVLLIEMAYGDPSNLNEGITSVRKTWLAVADLAKKCVKQPSQRPTMSNIRGELSKLKTDL